MLYSHFGRILIVGYHRTQANTKKILIYDGDFFQGLWHIPIRFWYLHMLYTSQVLKVVKAAEKDLFLHISLILILF